MDNEPPHGLRDYATFLGIACDAIKSADPGFRKGTTKKWCLPTKPEAVKVTSVVAKGDGDFTSRQITRNGDGQIEISLGEHPVLVEIVR